MSAVLIAAWHGLGDNVYLRPFVRLTAGLPVPAPVHWARARAPLQALPARGALLVLDLGWLAVVDGRKEARRVE